MENQILDSSQYSNLVKDLQILIQKTQDKVEKFARIQLVQTYWQVGKRITQEKLSENANYSALMINSLSENLNIDKKTLTRSVKFFRTYPNSPQNNSLNWSHYRYLITINDENLRLNLEEKTKNENWSAGKLAEKIKNLKEHGGKILAGTLENKLKRPAKANYLYRAKILNVVDGDTLILEIDLGFDVFKKQRIRLAQIDTPEIKTPEGKKSFEYLRNLAASLQQVVVRTNKVDLYGRFIGDVFYEIIDDGVKSQNEKVDIFKQGIYLNEKIVEAGMAKML
ncbi:MAG: endonuclease YncB(thermonuclease family) [Lentimonas sp.]|jgi:endonuclease YncB( thermonuclease family)